MAVVLLGGAAAAATPAYPSGGAPAPPTVEEADQGWTPGVDRARRYAERRRGDVRFAIIGLDGRMRGVHAARTAPAASVFKAMLLVTYLRRVADRALHDRDRALLGPMIRRSDNETATRVRDIVGRRAVRRLARDASMRDFRYHRIWGLSRTSSRDQARFFAKWDRFVPKRHERYARYLLSHIVSSQSWGIAKARPEGWRLYFKGGWGGGTGRVNHQTAFLEKGRCRIAISVMTEFSPSHRYGTLTQRGVAERLLEGINRAPCGKRFDQTGGATAVPAAP